MSADRAAIDRGPKLRAAQRATTVPGLLVLSGLAGLGYQVVWIRLLAVGLGVEAVALLAVVAAFFVGLALGGVLIERRIARMTRPALWYAGLEAVVGLWAMLLIPGIPVANRLIAGAMGPDPSEVWRWLVTFVGPLLLLAPATIAMGATFPAAERLHARLTGSTRSVGGLYAANVAGAAIGAAATLAVLAPNLGFNGTLGVFAMVNFACAVLTLAGPARMAAAHPDETGPVASPRSAVPIPNVTLLLFLTGLLGVGFEVAIARALAQTLENTVYSFASVLTLYLIGAAFGSGLWQRFGRDAGTSTLLWTLSACVLWGGALLPWTGTAYASLQDELGFAFIAELLVTAAVFLPAAVAMGALFARLAQRARRPDGGLGTALAANLAGAALAPLVVGVLVVPAVGVVATCGVLALAYLALGLLAAPRPRRALAGAVVAAAAVAGLATIDRRLISAHPGETVFQHREGTASSATVLSAADGANRLVVDGRFAMGGDATETVDRLQGHIPLLLHPDPRRALFLGLGAGATFAAAAHHPDLQAEAVELSPEVVDVLDAFAGPARDIAAAGLVVHTADARRWIRTTATLYDVIVADTFHPARDGAGLLYTVEHFAAVQARLAPNGLFAQWLPLHQFDLPTLRLVVRAFIEVFPDARLHMANANMTKPLLALIGTNGSDLPTVSALATRAQDARLREETARLGLDGPFALLGGHVAGPAALRDFAGAGPRNTDAFPHVIFKAPASIYSPLGPAADRLLALVELDADPADAVAFAPTARDGDFAQRLAAYWSARDAFLHLGAKSEITGNIHGDAARLAPALLGIVRSSPDYTPALRPLIALARALAPVDPVAAAALLRDIETAAPRRTETAAALAELPAVR